MADTKDGEENFSQMEKAILEKFFSVDEGESVHAPKQTRSSKYTNTELLLRLYGFLPSVKASLPSALPPSTTPPRPLRRGPKLHLDVTPRNPGVVEERILRALHQYTQRAQHRTSYLPIPRGTLVLVLESGAPTAYLTSAPFTRFPMPADYVYAYFQKAMEHFGMELQWRAVPKSGENGNGNAEEGQEWSSQPLDGGRWIEMLLNGILGGSRNFPE